MSYFQVVGNVVSDPTLRFTSGGKAVANFSVAENKGKRLPSGQWEDGDPVYHDIVAWDTLAENVAESCPTGTRVMVIGRLEKRPWEDKDGNKRVSAEVVADEVGPSLRWATATVVKTPRQDGNGRTPARSGARAEPSPGGGY